MNASQKMHALQQQILTEARSHARQAASDLAFKLNKDGLTPEQLLAVEAFVAAMDKAVADMNAAFEKK